MTRVLGGAFSARVVNRPNFPLKSPAAHLNNHKTDICDLKSFSMGLVTWHQVVNWFVLRCSQTFVESVSLWLHYTQPSQQHHQQKHHMDCTLLVYLSIFPCALIQHDQLSEKHNNNCAIMKSRSNLTSYSLSQITNVIFIICVKNSHTSSINIMTVIKHYSAKFMAVMHNSVLYSYSPVAFL